MRAILLLLALLACGQAEARMAQANGGRPAVGTPLVQPLTSVSLRSSSAGWPTITRVTAGGTFRQAYEIAATGTVRAIQVCYLNDSSTGATEADGVSSMAGVTASIEYGPTSNAAWDIQTTPKLQRFTWNLGSPSIPALSVVGGLICSDMYWHDFIPGQYVYIRTYAPPGVQYATYQGINASLDEYSNNGGFIVINNAITGNGVTTVFNGSTTQVTSVGSPALNVNLPLRANSLSLAFGSSLIVDDGAGNWVNSTGTQLVSGTQNYTDGTFSLTYSPAPSNGASIVAYGLSLGSSTAPDDTLVAHPPTFFFHGGSSFIPTAIPALAPAMILGFVAVEAPTQHTGCGVGDSIMSAIGNGNENKTYFEYMGNGLAWVRVGQGGERAFDWAQLDFRKRRMNMLIQVGCSRVLTGYGSNDITQGFSFTDIQTNLLAVWASLAAVLPHGFADITQATITPYTDLSNVPIDNALYGPGTVASGSPSMRNAVNNWICSMVGQPNGPAAVLDVNLAMELNPNSCTGAGDGKWFSLTYTSDGRHETNLAQKTILPARFSPTGTNPAAVFAP